MPACAGKTGVGAPLTPFDYAQGERVGDATHTVILVLDITAG